MADDLSRFHGLTRSQLMARIRCRGNKKTELAMMALLRHNEIKGWRRHQPLPGRPDFVFPRERTALFVDGCFWHGCPKHYRRPTTNSRFWSEKVDANRARDLRTTRALKRIGWRVLRVWECDIAREAGRKKIVRRILRALKSTRENDPKEN